MHSTNSFLSTRIFTAILMMLVLMSVLFSCTTMPLSPWDGFAIDNSRSKFVPFDPLDLDIIAAKQLDENASGDELIEILASENAEVMIITGSRKLIDTLKKDLRFNLALLSDTQVIATTGHILGKDSISAHIQFSPDYDLYVTTGFEQNRDADVRSLLIISDSRISDADGQIISLGEEMLYGRNLLPLENGADSLQLEGFSLHTAEAAMAEGTP